MNKFQQSERYTSAHSSTHITLHLKQSNKKVTEMNCENFYHWGGTRQIMAITRRRNNCPVTPDSGAKKCPIRTNHAEKKIRCTDTKCTHCSIPAKYAGRNCRNLCRTHAEIEHNGMRLPTEGKRRTLKSGRKRGGYSTS